MATAEKMFPLSATREFPVQQRSAVADQGNGLIQSLANGLSRMFGCWHTEMSRPFTRQGQTFRSCLSCGARREFDLRTWETRGEFYRVAA